MKRVAIALTLAMMTVMITASVAMAGTLVPGHDKDRYDVDNNGIPDEGVTTVGAYTSVYAYDCNPGCPNGGWYWDLGDGRIYGTVASIDDLDGATLTTCDYQVQYRAKFENTPYMDSGWILNDIRCYGYDDNNTYNYLIVHETDPRYEGNPDWSVWGTWEYHVLSISGYGNLVMPMTPVGAH